MRPAALDGVRNGYLPAELLDRVPGLDGGATVVLEHSAARAWRAMTAVAEAAGVTLRTNPGSRSYRSYAEQLTIWTARYYRAQSGILWNGYRWQKRSGVATAARPGTSNHGYGLAVDIALDEPEPLEWLRAEAARFGFYETVTYEPWHWVFLAGDDLPPGVIEHELSALLNPNEGTTMLHIRHDTTLNIYWSVDPGAPEAQTKEIDDPSGLKLQGVPILRSASMRFLMEHHWGITSHGSHSW